VTSASVASREFVIIDLTLTELNDLNANMGEIQNAYLMAPIWTVLGPDFGAETGKWELIVRALCGIKSAGAAFRNHFSACMDHLGWKPCLADCGL
jgi:hypothetical protein